MAKVIEISDSDEEQGYQEMIKNNIVPALSPPSNVNSEIQEHNAIMIQPNTSTECATTILNPALIAASIEPVTLNIAPIISEPDKLPTVRKHSRRKSMHQPIRLSPEIEFETIALDDDEETASSGAAAVPAATTTTTSTTITCDSVAEDEADAEATFADDNQPRPSTKSRSRKTTPKILTGKQPSSRETLIENACTELKLSEHTRALLRKIAEDRVRINFLLASFNMPEIQFSLYTQPSVLQFQLEERLKQRRMRYVEIARMRDAKRRRTMQQDKSQANT